MAALNAEDGQVLWHVVTGGELLSKPTVADDVVVVSTSSGALEAFNVDTGAKLWTYEMQLPNLTLRGTGSAAYEAGGFFIGTADGKVAVVVKTTVKQHGNKRFIIQLAAMSLLVWPMWI